MFPGCESMKESCGVSRPANQPVGTSKVALSFAVGDTMSSFQERSEGAKAEGHRITTKAFVSETAPPSPQVHQHSPIRHPLMNTNANLHLQSPFIGLQIFHKLQRTGSRQTKKILTGFSVIHHCCASLTKSTTFTCAKLRFLTCFKKWSLHKDGAFFLFHKLTQG